MGQQVTALTAEKTLELADENITGAVLSGGHLILRRRKWDSSHPTAPGTIIDVGSVIGPTGPSGGAKIHNIDTAGGVDDRLNSGGTTATVADTWYELDGVTVNTSALVVGNRYAVDYYSAFMHPEDLVNWDVDLLLDGVAKHRANAFAPNGGRSAVAQGTYYFTATSTDSIQLKMRARATVGTTAPQYAVADNSFASSTIAVIEYAD